MSPIAKVCSLLIYVHQEEKNRKIRRTYADEVDIHMAVCQVLGSPVATGTNKSGFTLTPLGAEFNKKNDDHIGPS